MIATITESSHWPIAAVFIVAIICSTYVFIQLIK